MFIHSKLGQNLSEMKVRAFVRIQRVIWLLRLKLSRIKVDFSLCAECHAVKNCGLVIIMLPVLIFLCVCFALFFSPAR